MTLDVEKVLEQSENTALQNIFSFPFLSDDECEQLVQVILKNRASNQQAHRGSMQKYTVDVIQLLSEFLKQRIHDEIFPLVNALFDDGEDVRYAFFTAHAVIYSASEASAEKALAIHQDDSDITLNFTLRSRDLAGCHVNFIGTTPFGNKPCFERYERMRLKLQEKQATQSVALPQGHCMIHRGSHLHETSRITQGERIALIVWLKAIKPL
jgi:hypothetical protein